MPRSVAQRLSDQEVTLGQRQVALPMVGAARTDQTPTSGHLPDGDWILPLVKRAQEHVMSQKAALITMGMPKTQYIGNLQGTGHLSVRRLGMLGESFWLALIDELRKHFKVDDDADRLRRALDGRAACDRVIDEIARKGAQR